jgi:hypothetical protein
MAAMKWRRRSASRKPYQRGGGNGVIGGGEMAAWHQACGVRKSAGARRSPRHRRIAVKMQQLSAIFSGEKAGRHQA